MKGIKLHISLVEQVVRDKDTVLFSKWLSFKYMHKNSRLYNYNPNKAAGRYKEVYGQPISPKTVSSNVTKFIDKGWCYLDHSGHLVFDRQSNIVKSYGLDNFGSFDLYFKNKKNLDYKTIKLKIYKEMFNKKISQQHLLLEVHSEHCKAEVSKKAAKCFNESVIEKNISKVDNVVNISYDGLAKVFNTSKSEAFYIMKNLVSSTGLVKERRIEKVSSDTSLSENLNEYAEKGHFFRGKNFTFVTYTNRYFYV